MVARPHIFSAAGRSTETYRTARYPTTYRPDQGGRDPGPVPEHLVVHGSNPLRRRQIVPTAAHVHPRAGSADAGGGRNRSANPTAAIFASRRERDRRSGCEAHRRPARTSLGPYLWARAVLLTVRTVTVPYPEGCRRSAKLARTPCWRSGGGRDTSGPNGVPSREETASSTLNQTESTVATSTLASRSPASSSRSIR